jgi:hypothetical protein
MRLIFGNGEEFEPMDAKGAQIYFQGALRDSFTFEFDANSNSFDELREIFSDELAASEIELIPNETESYWHKGYSILVNITYRDEKFSVTMAQVSEAEDKLKQMESVLDVALSIMNDAQLKAVKEQSPEIDLVAKFELQQTGKKGSIAEID